MRGVTTMWQRKGRRALECKRKTRKRQKQRRMNRKRVRGQTPKHEAKTEVEEEKRDGRGY
jgi:hypothetical protein